MDDSKNNVPSFIGKLGLMLKDKSAMPFVTWSQGGESVVVLDPPTFATQVLPRWAPRLAASPSPPPRRARRAAICPRLGVAALVCAQLPCGRL
jgi:hypothetical protein